MAKIQNYVEMAQPYDKDDPEEGGEANIWSERMRVLERFRVSVEDLLLICEKVQADTEMIRVLLAKEEELAALKG